MTEKSAKPKIVEIYYENWKHKKMNAELYNMIFELRKMALKDHFHVDEDCRYSCYAHPECCNEHQTGICNCGADKHNEDVENLYWKIVKFIVNA